MGKAALAYNGSDIVHSQGYQHLPFTEVIRKAAPNHPFEEHCDPTIVNIILAYHSCAIEQSIYLRTPYSDPRKWHPFGPSILEVSCTKTQTPGRT